MRFSGLAVAAILLLSSAVLLNILRAAALFPARPVWLTLLLVPVRVPAVMHRVQAPAAMRRAVRCLPAATLHPAVTVIANFHTFPRISDTRLVPQQRKSIGVR
jgi:hypothetical protein